MTGYADYSKSNNAVAAESEGRFPLTKAAKLAGVPAALVKNHVKPREWHHTSGWFNRTNYFDPREIRIVFGLEAAPSQDDDAWASLPDHADPAAVAALAAYAPVTALRHEGCTAVWVEWSGSRRHAKATDRRAEDLTVTIKGATAILHLPTGDVVKKISARGFEVKAADGKLIVAWWKS